MVKIFTDLAGVRILNYNNVVTGVETSADMGIPRVDKSVLEGGTANLPLPALVEEAPGTDPSLSLAADFLKSRGPTTNALHQEIALNANLEHAQDAMQILRGMDDVSNKHGHLLGLELNAVGDRLRQVDLSSKWGNAVKLAVATGIVALGVHTAIEGSSTINAIQQLATGASDLTKGLQNSTDVLHIDLANINLGGKEINEVISRLTQHGVDTVISGAATGLALLARPFEVVRKASHGLGRTFNVAGGAIGKALGTENVISPQVPKPTLQVVDGGK